MTQQEAWKATVEEIEELLGKDFFDELLKVPDPVAAAIARGCPLIVETCARTRGRPAAGKSKEPSRASYACQRSDFRGDDGKQASCALLRTT